MLCMDDTLKWEKIKLAADVLNLKDLAASFVCCSSNFFRDGNQGLVRKLACMHMILLRFVCAL